MSDSYRTARAYQEQLLRDAEPDQAMMDFVGQKPKTAPKFICILLKALKQAMTALQVELQRRLGPVG
ncbi:MAG: hypothetical protein PVF47_07370 [Anaerolineae bacterium]